MSNSIRKPTLEEKARYFDLESKISKLFQEGNRSPDEVLNAFQMMIENRNFHVDLGTILTFSIEAKSLLDLKEEYGTGSNGFYNNTWWLDEDFAKSVPEPGTYEINIEKQLANMTYNEQAEGLDEGWDFPHPAVIAQAILKHYQETGERILENWYTRTSFTDSDGHHVSVGYFYSDGLYVYYHWDDYRDSCIGIAAARKSNES